MSDFPLWARVSCSAEARAAFEEGTLRERWHETYHRLGVFDTDDLRLARNQPWSHFYEWLAAVTIYEATGWLSLVEKYQFGSHARKREILDRLGATAFMRFVTHQKSTFGNQQAPDLLVYRPDLTDYAFCEVKGPTDHLGDRQAQYFRALREATQRPIYLFRVERFEEM